MPADPLTPVALTTAKSEWQGEALVAALRQRGIQAVAQGGMLSGFRAEAPAQVTVVVARQDLARAKEALTQIGSDSIDIDWEDVDVGPAEEPGAVEAPAADHEGRRASVIDNVVLAVIVLWVAGLVIYALTR